MSPVNSGPAIFTLTLTEEERKHLLIFLDQALREVAVEVHRTDALDYRMYVEGKEAALRSVRDKLSQS